MIWFTADTHFGHANIIRLTDRPYRTVGEMDRALVANINARVAPTDELYVLGDFSYRITVEEARAIRGRIRCRHVHILRGNHDKDWSNPSVAGTFMVEAPIAILKAQDARLVLSHYPLEDWQGQSHGAIMLHGHIHSRGTAYNELCRSQGMLRYDVGVDANGYAPVSLDDILAWFGHTEPVYRSWRGWAPVAVPPKAYLVVSESGEYSDFMSYVESVHTTYAGAVAAIESRVLTRYVVLDESADVRRLLDDDPAEGWERHAHVDGEACPRTMTVFCHPRRHGSRIGGLGDAWYLDRDGAYEAETWHIEERVLET